MLINVLGSPGISDMNFPQGRVLLKAVLGAWVLAAVSNTPTFHLCVPWVESLGEGMFTGVFCTGPSGGEWLECPSSYGNGDDSLSKECTNNHITPPSLVDPSHGMVLGQGP